VVLSRAALAGVFADDGVAADPGCSVLRVEA
jgi:hypothetical protein